MSIPQVVKATLFCLFCK